MTAAVANSDYSPQRTKSSISTTNILNANANAVARVMATKKFKPKFFEKTQLDINKNKFT